jgi:hypothetical protein
MIQGDTFASVADLLRKEKRKVVGAKAAEAMPCHGFGQGVPEWDLARIILQTSNPQPWPWERKIGSKIDTDLDPAATCLFSRRKKIRKKPTTTRY